MSASNGIYSAGSWHPVTVAVYGPGGIGSSLELEACTFQLQSQNLIAKELSKCHGWNCFCSQNAIAYTLGIRIYVNFEWEVRNVGCAIFASEYIFLC